MPVAFRPDENDFENLFPKFFADCSLVEGLAVGFVIKFPSFLSSLVLPSLYFIQIFGLGSCP